jgi:hypothetical protein
MPNRTVKKTPIEPRIATDNKRKTSTPKAKTKRSTARFYEVKIRLSAENYARGQPYFDEMKYLPKFFIDAYTEKVNRAEAHDKEAKQRNLISNINLLKPVLKEMHARGELEFLNERKERGNER